MGSAWFDLCERSLRAEEKQQFRNIRGREFFFADFMLFHLDNFEKRPEHAKIISRLQNIYTLYPLNSVAERRKVVEETRRLLAGLRDPREIRQVVKAQVQAEAKEESGSDWRDVPVQFVKGVGPKLGALFAKVGVGTPPTFGLFALHPHQRIACRRDGHDLGLYPLRNLF
jgi:hypothetical protein